MNDAALQPATQDIVFDEVFPHTPEMIWKVMTTGELIGRWMMTATGFEPVKGKHFTFTAKPDAEWDGIIHCQVLEAKPNERLVYTWKTGNETTAGYVSRLDTLVTWTLARHDGGTRLRLVHSGFDLPQYVSVFRNVSAGWPKVIGKMIAIVAEQDSANR
jgi:uncharacterized protein YndB with AHSA1/START domain